MQSMLRSNAGAFRPILTDGSNSYQPGVCNIGPDEIARRRRAGHVGLAVTVALLAILLILHAPPVWRLVIALPAAAAAVTYLQAILHFCVGFARLGVFNFGELGGMTRVGDEAARRADQAKALRMIAAGCAIGLSVGILAVLL
jgi:hypothetical protein